MRRRIQKLLLRIIRLVFDYRPYQKRYEPGTKSLSLEDYYNQLSYPLGHHAPPETSSDPDWPTRRERAERAFEMVLDTRKFEIDMYWKRATYFWAFIASAFVGYVTLLEKGLNYSAFIIICTGFILSCAWHLTNLGSKSWQRHWEKHLDLLEDPFVGPLYKTIYPEKTFSVTKINAIVSFVFCVVWILLGWHFLDTNNYLHFSLGIENISWIVVIPLTGTLMTLISMLAGYGRGRFGKQNAAMLRRTYYYSMEERNNRT